MNGTHHILAYADDVNIEAYPNNIKKCSCFTNACLAVNIGGGKHLRIRV